MTSIFSANFSNKTKISFVTCIGNASIWVQQHTIYYRPIEDESQSHAHSQPGSSNAQSTRASTSSSSSSSRKHSEKSSSKSMRKKLDAQAWTENVQPSVSPITQFLSNVLPKETVTVQDASLDALCMLRIVHALNRHWETLYNGNYLHEDIVPSIEFIHSKVCIVKSSVQSIAFKIQSDPFLIISSIVFLSDHGQSKPSTPRPTGHHDR